MKRLLRYILVWRSSLSREGTIGIGLIVISLIAYFLLLEPAQSRLMQLQQEVMALSDHDHGAKTHERPTPATPSDELHAFYRFFPPSTSIPDWLEKIFTASEKQHLVLNKGKYRVKHQLTGSLLRYQIMFPVTGNYRQVHGFLAKVLTEVPNAALDGVSFERHEIGNTQVEAKIKMTIYLVRPS